MSERSCPTHERAREQITLKCTSQTTDLGREEESTVQRSSSSKVVEAFLRRERQGDIEPAPVGTGMHIARRFHGIAISDLRATFPVQIQRDGINCLRGCTSTS